MSSPIVYLIGGPNGAGKTTTAFSIMPELIDCYEYVNADAIAAALSPFRPQEVAMDAGRVMLQRIKALADQRVDFAFETTMASRSFDPLLRNWKADGYTIRLIYFWLQSVELAVERVHLRVQSGGHFVSEEIVIRRYRRSIINLFSIYLPLADRWSIFDNSQREPKLIAEKDILEITIHNAEDWSSLNSRVSIET